MSELPQKLSTRKVPTTKHRDKIKRDKVSKAKKEVILETIDQWFPGSDNDVADCLSRDFHLSIPLLTNLLISHAKSQLPPSFKIPSPPIRDRLMALFSAGEAVHQDSTTGQNQDDRARS